MSNIYKILTPAEVTRFNTMTQEKKDYAKATETLHTINSFIQQHAEIGSVEFAYELSGSIGHRKLVLNALEDAGYKLTTVDDRVFISWE